MNCVKHSTVHISMSFAILFCSKSTKGKTKAYESKHT